MDSVTIRKATAADMPRIAELVAGNPGEEAIGVMGSVRAARRLGLGVYRIAPYTRAWEQCAVAEAGGSIVGVVMSGAQMETMGVTLPLAWLAIRTLGPIGALRAQPRLRARSRVQTKTPDGAYHIGELDVDPEQRNRGIGGALLDHVEAEARASGHKLISLSTTTSNPARRLYERHGFRVIETKTDPEYERITGIEGRVLMAKDLD